MTDFSTLDVAQIDAFLADHADELDMDFDAGELLDRFAAGSAMLELRPFGFAVITIKPLPAGMEPHLWAIYIDPARRGNRQGHRFMREILRKYSVDYHMTLSCRGAARRRFFGRLGFRVESRDGEWRRMTTNDYQGFRP